jgi:acetyl-CoA carboxylase biotin carboxyl carrier protein
MGEEGDLAELSDADILRILELIDKSSFDYFQLTLGDLNITVSKTGLPPEGIPGVVAGAGAAPPAAASAPPPGPAAAPPPPPPSPAPAASAAPVPPPSAPPVPAPTPADAAAREGRVPVPAPMVGTFYVAPAPDAPPFVQVGGTVQADTTVGLVEAMKVFTSVMAGANGVVAERLVDNAQFVEYGQALFLIRPESS